MSVTFLIIEQTITYLHRRCSSELQIFILVFQKKNNHGGFLFGIKTWKTSKLSSQFGLIWRKFDLQIFHQAHFNEAAFVLFLIISWKMLRKEAKTPTFFIATMSKTLHNALTVSRSINKRQKSPAFWCFQPFFLTSFLFKIPDYGVWIR